MDISVACIVNDYRVEDFRGHAQHLTSRRGVASEIRGKGL